MLDQVRRCPFSLMTALPLLSVLGESSIGTDAATIYTNPIAEDFAEDSPDVGVSRGKDGYRLAYATATLLDNCGTGHDGSCFIPVARPALAARGRHMGGVFGKVKHPTWV
jgi:hypothetical protein